jgi:hypothetical protein
VVGVTHIEYWRRLWKANRGDPELDAEEWVRFLEGIDQHFRRQYENCPDEFFFWGDYSGDRTLDMKIADPTILTADLLSDLQEYLRANGQEMWRIRIPIFFKRADPRLVVAIYPHTVNVAPIFTERQRQSQHRSHVRKHDSPKSVIDAGYARGEVSRER